LGRSHNIYRIGHFDPEVGRLVYREPERFLYTTVGKELGLGLPVGEVSTRPIEFNLTNPREKGFEFEFKPERLGIYLIDGYWRTNKLITMNTQPMVLVVTPPLNANGTPIVKPEWLK